MVWWQRLRGLPSELGLGVACRGDGLIVNPRVQGEVELCEVRQLGEEGGGADAAGKREVEAGERSADGVQAGAACIPDARVREAQPLNGQRRGW